MILNPARRRCLLGGLAGSVLALPVRAAQEQAVHLPGTEQFSLATSGGGYQVMVRPPRQAPRFAAGHPVLYLLDGNAFFGAYYDAARMQSELADDAILVAVGYPTPEPFDLARRAYDFTPPLPVGQTPQPGWPTLGGELEMMAFLSQQLLPDIARRFPVDAHRQVLLGHSFGGMFALSLFYAQPERFSQIVAISPSVWWQDHFILARERAFTAQAQAGKVALLGKRLLLMAGGAESAQTLQLTHSLARRLDSALSGQGLEVGHVVLADETHLSVPVAAATTVLRQVLTARRV
ncbi:alpha/beta fold hydrolase [Alcaligenes sp. 13f]|uniref:alpha/beta hydrolase n=1 Tax=Alcaligenes sp. 13f TaxID=2841924 RepID=UPI001CF6765A|nr:alpha/beta fold hydrolase [Alcaligenes sp. 13f]MCB4320713.1 alpha/beta fold hydrolase [Alcaligenes sp. 13f]